jgi:type I restriction enzyme, S subunit
MEVKKGYKQTEVGVIPEDWKVKPLNQLVGFTNGKAHENSIKDDGKYIVVNSKFISSEGKVVKFSDDCFCPTEAENILMVMSDVPNGKAIAKCFFVDKDNCYTVNQRICSLKVKVDDPKLLFYLINRNRYYLTFDDGVKQTNLRRDDVLGCPIPLPPTKAEQTAIATTLSDADALISSLEKLIAKKRNIKQGAMQELLTGKKRLPGFSGEWEVKKLGEVLEVRYGKSQKEIVDGNGEYPILATGGVVGRTSTFIYNKPSVLIGRKGTIDVPQYMDTPFWAIDTIFYTEILDNAFPKFIFYKFNLIDWYCHNEASGVPSLNAKSIEKIELLFPPTKEEQQTISHVLSDMDAEIEQLEQKLHKYRMIKQGMMQELLTGKTRLI